jgi:hypothetical protein
MGDRSPEGARPEPAEVEKTGDTIEAETVLANIVGRGLPLVCIVAAIAVGFVSGVGPALLVVAFGALVGTIALLWASLRTLSGDAPLPEGLERSASQTHGGSAAGERKRRVMRALKDLEAEHAIGKIDDADYALIAGRYRQEAKLVLRELDDEVAPARAEAEKLAREYFARGATSTKRVESAQRSSRAERMGCPTCSTSNEADASFCKQCGAALPGKKGEVDATK